MVKRIFKYTELTILVTLILGFSAILLIQYNYFDRVQMNQLKTETRLAAEAVNSDGIKYLKSLKTSDPRITWVSKSGKVIYDNQADASKMGNHASRPEISEAMENGTGTSTRYSKTMTTAMLYSARRLKDGSVIRIAESRDTVLAAALGMLFPMILVLIVLMIITGIFSSKMSKRIVDPLNKFDLENPLNNDEYPELAPFLHKIHDQQREIKEQKAALDKAEEDFSTVTENMTEGLVLLSDEEKVMTINNKAKSLFGTDDSCKGKDVLYLERRSDFADALKKAESGTRTELIMTFAGRSYQTVISPVKNGSDMAGMVILLFDVTEREDAEKMRREFTGNVSHELKTPLHTISGCAELLKSGEVKKEDRDKFVTTIYKETQRMISLVEDILYISHLDEGALDMKWEKVDVRKVADLNAEKLAREAEMKNVKLNVSGSAPEIDGIYRLVDSVVFNLMINAVKYNKDGGSVDVSVEDAGDDIRLTVSDTGIGIPEEDMPRIFERFYRVDKSHSREIGGTGLGLSIVKHVAEILDAKVDVKSRQGEGTTFTVLFPKQRSDVK